MSEHDFAIEEVTDLDAAWPEIKTLFVGLMEYHEGWFPRPLRDDWEQRSHDYVALGDDRLILIVRNAGGEAVGYVNASIRRDYGIFDELVGFIEDAFVREDCRHAGLGTQLLSRVEAWHASRGISDVRLQVLLENSLGRDFWERHGFSPLLMTMRKTLSEAAL